jgi:hypothetical protein
MSKIPKGQKIASIHKGMLIIKSSSELLDWQKELLTTLLNYLESKTDILE